MADGRWQMADGRWQMADGRWQVAGGRWQMAGGRWQMADGRWQMAGDSQDSRGNVLYTSQLVVLSKSRKYLLFSFHVCWTAEIFK
jgi:hypothetical protein